MPPVLQDRLPYATWMDPKTARLPGIQPVEGEDWLRVDEAYAAQMALRDGMITERPGDVLALLPEARPAAEELYDMVLARLSRVPGYQAGTGAMRRPDGVSVPLDRSQPLHTLGRLVQEDLCLLQKQGDEHVLTGAVLCFPANWSLDEKLGRPLLGIHRTVKSYDPDLGLRVQRLFDMIRPEQPLWRMNALIYRDPTLYQPGREASPRIDRHGGNFVRSERQTLLRLPQSGAVLFAIHTYVVGIETLSDEELSALREARH